MTANTNKIGKWHGAGLLATTLLGTSVFILPQMTVNIAQDGAMSAWLLLTLTIIPVALVFAKLAAAFPHAAGPAYFVEKAYGVIPGRTIGLMFLCVVPLGAPAAIMMTFQFMTALISLSDTQIWLGQLSFLLLLFILNFRGIQISASLQFLLTLAIIVVLVTLLGLNSSSGNINSETSNVSISPILAAAGIAFWSFLGVEAMAHLAGDFKDPKRDLIPAIMIGTLLVGLIYIGCTYLVLQVTTETPLAMVGIFDQLIGGGGAWVIGVLGIAGGVATVNVYTASLTRLMCSFGKDRVLPAYFAKQNQYGVSVRSLTVLLCIMAVVITISHFARFELEHMLAWVNGVFVMIYFASMLAAFKLLPNLNKSLILLACGFCLMLCWGLGWQMGYAILLFFVIAPLLHLQQIKQAQKALIV